MNDKFKNLIKMLDNELEAYTELRDLFAEKKELLKKAKSDDLGVLDNKIISVNNRIIELNDLRKEASINLIGKDGCMSEFIAFAEENMPNWKTPLETRKVKICNVIEELTLLNKQNVELLNHGITITNKMLETIVNAFAPQGSIYNGTGKTDSQDLDMWTVNEEI